LTLPIFVSSPFIKNFHNTYNFHCLYFWEKNSWRQDQKARSLKAAQPEDMSRRNFLRAKRFNHILILSQFKFLANLF
jgi:hypothetical protein